MIPAPLAANEIERVEALLSYGLLDSAPEQEYDAITELASRICGTSISLITLIDDTRQWFKSAHGTEVRQSLKEAAFCAHAITDPQPVFIVPDLRLDKRFSGNPFVTNEPHVVFYAGVPLVDEGGFALGTLCVIDQGEKVLSEMQISALKTLAAQVVSLMHQRRKNKTLQTFNKLLQERNGELQKRVELTMELEPKLAALSEMMGLFQETLPGLTEKGTNAVKEASQILSEIKAVFQRSKEIG